MPTPFPQHPKASHDARVVTDTLTDGSKVYAVHVEATYQTGQCVDVVLHCTGLNEAHHLADAIMKDAVSIDVNANMKGGAL